MFDLKWIRDNPDAFDDGLKRRGAEPCAKVIIAIDEERRAHLQKLQDAQQQRNTLSKQIGKAMSDGDKDLAEKLKSEVAELKTFVQSGEDAERAFDARIAEVLSGLPNLPLDETPDGPDEEANVEVRRVGEQPPMDFEPKLHFELGEALGMMDFEAAARMSGARFVVLIRDLARLERAIGQFMIDLQTGENGYRECSVPLMVKDHAMYGTGQLPKFMDDQFFPSSSGSRAKLLGEALDKTTPDQEARYRDGEISLRELVEDVLEHAPTREDFWLIPTAEVPLSNMVREQVVDEADLPMRLTALTPCFRAEAGAAGRDTRGMIRQHQFYKVEMVSITLPDRSRDELDRMTGCAEEVLKRLGLHYRVVALSTGDMGFGARLTFDIEVWLPGENTFREISSCSVCGDFQARRMNARFKPAEGGANQFVHTLNGSGLAVGRTLIAVMENYQNADGSITIPDVLRPYMGGQDKIGA
ncbi:MAG: serine--tRNA ligase [Rhizobiales bacterium]|nr:serine--tRNA ligase [Hyphomicrobiales bacterium]